MFRITFILLITLLTFSCKKKDKDNPNPTSTVNSCIYDFTKSIITYTPIASPDGYYNGYDGSGTDGAISIPFPFKVCGKSVSQFDADVNDIYFISTSSEQVYMTYNMENLNPSYVSWKTEGIAGNRIQKIQFQDRVGSIDNLNFQVWLYENGNKIEAHYGMNNARIASSLLPFLIRREMATTLQGIALSGSAIDPNEGIYVGNANSPVMHCLNNNSDPDNYVVKGTLTNGLTYLFTPHN